MKTALKSAFVLLPVLFVACYIQRYAVNMLFQDEFAMIDLCVADSPTLDGLFAQHGEHRPFFPRLLYFAVAKTTAMNSVAQLVAGMVLAGLTLAMAGVYLKTEMGDAFKTRHLAFAAFVVFGMAQYLNWLAGWQIVFFMTATAATAAFLFMHLSLTRARTAGGRWGYVVLACAGAGVASFSSMHGLVAWVVLALGLTVHLGAAAFKDLRFYATLFAGFACYALYFQGFMYPRDAAPLLHAFRHYGEFVRFGARFMGTALAPETYSAILAGGALAVAGLYVAYDYARRADPEENGEKPGPAAYGFFPVCLIAFALLVALETGARLTNLGSDVEGRSSRYATFSLMAALGVALYIFVARKNANPDMARPWPRRLATLFLAGVCVSFFFHAWRAEGYGDWWRYQRRMSAFVISTYRTQPEDKVLKAGGYKSKYENDADRLRPLGYNLYAWLDMDVPAVLDDPAKRLPVTGRPPTLFRWNDFHVERGERDPYIEFASWAVDPVNKAPLDSVYLYFNDRMYKVFYGNPRDDVAKFMGDERFRFCGFERYIPLSEFPDGEYAVSLRLVNHDRTGYYDIDPNAKMTVRHGRFSFDDRHERPSDADVAAMPPEVAAR